MKAVLYEEQLAMQPNKSQRVDSSAPVVPLLPVDELDVDALVWRPDGAGGVVVDVHGRRVGARLRQPVRLQDRAAHHSPHELVRLRR